MCPVESVVHNKSQVSNLSQNLDGFSTKYYTILWDDVSLLAKHDCLGFLRVWRQHIALGPGFDRSQVLVNDVNQPVNLIDRSRNVNLEVISIELVLTVEIIRQAIDEQAE